MVAGVGAGMLLATRLDSVRLHNQGVIFFGRFKQISAASDLAEIVSQDLHLGTLSPDFGIKSVRGGKHPERINH